VRNDMKMWTELGVGVTSTVGDVHGKFRFSLIWIESEQGSSVLVNREIVLEF